jgi:hypothetical protein
MYISVDAISNSLFSISSWQLQFIQSEFKGQLPQPYAAGPTATQTIPANMNDQNLEEPTRYVSQSGAATNQELLQN